MLYYIVLYCTVLYYAVLCCAGLYCRCNVAAIRATYSEYACVCVCGLRYPARNAHAPNYIVICGLFGCTICYHILLLTVHYRENLFSVKSVCSDFLYNSVCTISHSEKNCTK